MPFYSFKVKSPDEVILSSRSLAIGEGIDVFNSVIDDLPEFLAELREFGVQVLEYHQLDDLEAIEPTYGLIPGMPEEVGLLSTGEQYPPEAEEQLRGRR